MKTPPKLRPEITALTRRFLEETIAKRNPNERLAIALLWFAGLRISEVVKLRWTDVELIGTTRPMINVDPTTTKTKVGRKLPIPLPLARALEEDLTSAQSEPPLLPPTGYVVHHRSRDKPLSPRAIQYAINDACRALNIAHLAPHDFRHSFATRMLRASNIKITQLALGHRSITSTALYTHPTLDEIERAMTKAALEE